MRQMAVPAMWVVLSAVLTSVSQRPSGCRKSCVAVVCAALGPAVDVTNYVLLELGQPMHAFDLSKIDGGIVVRMGRNEKLKLLDESEVTRGYRDSGDCRSEQSSGHGRYYGWR